MESSTVFFLTKVIVLGFILIFLFILITRFISIEAPHQDRSPPPQDCAESEAPQFDEEGFEIINTRPLCHHLDRINQAYLQKIKPIFKARCLHCHGVANSFPLYSKIPPASWLVQDDLEEAKKHMDMTFDFPFAGHGTPKDDFEALAKVVNEGTMPPLRYRIMHWQSQLTDEEKKEIHKWIGDSLKILGQ